MKGCHVHRLGCWRPREDQTIMAPLFPEHTGLDIRGRQL